MKIYLVLNENGEGDGFFESTERIKPNIPKERLVELSTITEKDRTRIKENPHYFVVKDGNLEELDDTKKAEKDKAREDAIPKRDKSTVIKDIVDRLSNIETKLQELEEKK